MCNAEAMRETTFSGFARACSQNRSTRQPVWRSRRVVARSLAAFREIFSRQYRRLSRGIRQCHRQPCQKQPSTNTARRCFGKMKSGFPGNGQCLRQPLSPWARRIEASFNSVALLPFDRMAAMVCERFRFEKMSAMDFVPFDRHSFPTAGRERRLGKGRKRR